MSTQVEDKSLSELEREAEHTRANLIHTVDELHSRVSPQAIKDEVKAYARDTGNELIHTIERKARENPLQTVAVAAGLAYPAWRFLINIPAPILLVGAGLALSQFGGEPGRTASIRSGTRGEKQEGEHLTDSLKRAVKDASADLSNAAEGLKEKVVASAEQARASVSSGLGAIRSHAAAAIDNTTEVAADTMTAAADAISATYRSGMNTASRTGDQLSESFKQSKEAVFETIERHPFIIGGVGLLIGAVIASALPVSQAENRLFGDTSDDLKDRARDIASEGLKVAETAAQDVYQEAASRVRQEGLSPDVVRQTVKDVGDKIKNVAQQTAETLDGKPAQSPSSNRPYS